MEQNEESEAILKATCRKHKQIIPEMSLSNGIKASMLVIQSEFQVIPCLWIAGVIVFPKRKILGLTLSGYSETTLTKKQYQDSEFL